jgi:integrase
MAHGLAAVRCHDLRHFSLTMAAAPGATTGDLMRRAGHASPRYDATDDRGKAVVEALSGLMVADVVQLDAARPSRGQAADNGVR